MNEEERSILSRLAERGVLPPEAVTAEHSNAERPWFISIVLGAAGWLAGLFALMFIAILFKPDGPAGYATVGALMLGAAFGLYYADKESAFFDQLALAFSIAGQIALAVAVADATESVRITAWAIALLQAALLFALPNRFAKSLATFFACIALAIAVRFTVSEVDDPFDRPAAVAVAPAVLGWLLVWVPIIALTRTLITREAQWLSSNARNLARPALTGLLVSLSIGTVASEPLGAFTMWLSEGDRAVNWLAMWPLLATFTALFAAVCAYRLQHRALIGVAIVGALLHVVQFYFLLGISLLLKSCIMLIIGGALLVIGRWLKHEVKVTA